MKTVRILEGFHAYPNDKRRHFAEGEELELSNEFADLVVGKGLAVETAKAPKSGAASNPE